MISNNAKLLCVVSGITLGFAVAMLMPHSNFEKRVVSARDFIPELDTKWRSEIHKRTMFELTHLVNPCGVKTRMSARSIVLGYYGAREESIALAERYLAPQHTEEVRKMWESPEDATIKKLIIAAAQSGYFGRDDFRPTTYVGLVRLLETEPAVALSCPS
jgi:hypothetical protein